METLSSFLFPKGYSNSSVSYWLVGLFLAAGLALSVFSWLELCVQHCSANQEYRLFGYSFAKIGILFFTTLTLLHLLSKKFEILKPFVGWLIASALGAEFVFIAIQHYEIGRWCPVCLAIAATILFAALVLLFGYIKSFNAAIHSRNREEIMQKIKNGCLSVFFIILGTLLAFIGIGKANTAEAAAKEMKDRLAFGTKNSPIEVYFITDWYCPACRKIEPLIEKLYPQIKSDVSFYFIDYAIHKKSLNFTPYNLAFLANDKPKYFQARQLLMNVAKETESPNDEDISQASTKQGLHFKELPYLDVKTGIEFFDTVSTKYKLHATPTIIITRPSRNQIISLEGADEISEKKVLEAIEKLKKTH